MKVFLRKRNDDTAIRKTIETHFNGFDGGGASGARVRSIVQQSTRVCSRLLLKNR
jgi:hypothetical protein